MTGVEMLDLPGIGDGPGPIDNVTDWALRQFTDRYGPHVTKDDVWEYLYGVMHATDWRARYANDLRRRPPRVPLADDFEAFATAGRELMDLHIGYETVECWPVPCFVDDEPDDGDADPDAYRIDDRMRWGRGADGKRNDKSVLEINDRCKLASIPDDAHGYEVSGRTPLEWAMASLRYKHDKRSDIIDNPNGWHAWADDPYQLIQHLRRLVAVSVRSTRIIRGLPTSLPPAPTARE